MGFMNGCGRLRRFETTVNPSVSFRPLGTSVAFACLSESLRPEAFLPKLLLCSLLASSYPLGFLSGSAWAEPKLSCTDFTIKLSKICLASSVLYEFLMMSFPLFSFLLPETTFSTWPAFSVAGVSAYTLISQLDHPDLISVYILHLQFLDSLYSTILLSMFVNSEHIYVC